MNSLPATRSADTLSVGEELPELAKRADVVLVLGSQNSSNSKRLAEIANSLGPHVSGTVVLDLPTGEATV